MKHFLGSLFLASMLWGATGCTSDQDSTDVKPPSTKTRLDLNDVKTTPANYQWFDFRPNVMKLILSGAAETEHVAILWYTVPNGAVCQHYHSKTESVYVIDGTQTDAKGVYPTGTVYFNPPGSGHAITNSSGFFILAYASPPDFASTGLIGEYTPLRIDTEDSAVMGTLAFAEPLAGVRTFQPPLDGMGGMSSELIDVAAPGGAYAYSGNYVLVLEGRCDIDGEAFGEETLVVASGVAPEPFLLTAAEGASCLAMGVSF